MTQYATPEAVKGDFQNVTLELSGETYRLEQRGEGFWAEMVDPQWKLEQRTRGLTDPVTLARGPRLWKRIGMLTGSHHMQAYWVAARHGNLQISFPFSYLLEDQRWVPRNDAFLMNPAVPPPLQAWNANCLQCHATAGQPRPDAADPGLLQTRVGEIGIACEACHGPAQAHLEANRDPLRRYGLHRQEPPDTTIVQPERLDHQKASQVCGQCHAIKAILRDWRQEGFQYRPGADLEQSTPVVRPTIHAGEPWLKELLKKDPTFLEDRYWSDGMARVSGREFNGLVESPCYQRGTLSCLSCHSMHQSEPNDQLAARMDTDQACLQCHQTIRVAEHTHHPAGSSGQACYNCHMPHTTYGLLKAIRSHQIDSPTIKASVQTGRPNACNLCHLDKSLAWTAHYLSAWFGAPKPELSTEEQTVAASVLWSLRGDAGQRALLAWHMGWEPARKASGEKWLVPYLAHLLEDPYSAVRYIAHRSLRRIPGFQSFAFDYIGPVPERAQARLRARAHWERTLAASLDRSGPEILVESNGALRQETWERLLSQRNDRPMFLQE